MGCSDPAITYLRHYGYSVVRLPKADLACLELLADAGGRELERFGRLDTVLVAGGQTALPPVTADVQAASISGERSGELSVGVGLSVLGGVLAAMGGSKLGLDVSFKRATSVVFEFADVLEDRIEPAKLDQYLGEADLDPRSVQAERLLEADDLYVTTALIKSRKFTIEASASRSAGAEQVSVPEIQQVVGATVKVSGAAPSRRRRSPSKVPCRWSSASKRSVCSMTAAATRHSSRSMRARARFGRCRRFAMTAPRRCG